MSQITKIAIENALKELLLVKPLDKITVSELTEKCGINRMTFYYHFKDIYDLMEWSLIEEASKALENRKTYETWMDGYLDIFNWILDNKIIILNVYNSLSREHLETYLHKVTLELLLDVVEEKSKGYKVTKIQKEFIANFFKYAFVGIIFDWIKNSMKEEPKNLIKNINLIIEGDFQRALERFQEKGDM